jgi:hypothetical protein
MRGWLTLFTRERRIKRYATGIFIATAEPELTGKVLTRLSEDFPHISFTLLGPRSYNELFTARGTPMWLEDIKAAPLRSLRKLRQQKFDLAIAVFNGRPTFRKPKLATFLLNPSRFVFYNENADALVLERGQRRAAAAHLMKHSHFLHFGPLLFVPFGFLYLVGRTLRLKVRGQLQLSSTSHSN